MLDKLAQLKERFEYVGEQLADPDVLSDVKRFAKVNKEYKKLEPIVKAYDEYKSLLDRQAEAKDILVNSNDEELREMAKMEIAEIDPLMPEVEAELKELLIPRDPEDEKDVMIEIHSGTGGDEAAIFAGDLLRMYIRFIDKQGWRYEEVAATPSESGGYSKVIIQVTGDNVYGKLKYESGTHRVQRVPKTEAQGRVHTSAATVAVLPIFEMEDVSINPADLEWDVFRSSGAGGQHVNRTESAVRVTHRPTGTVVECQEGRSQIKNREIALQKLYARLYEMQKQQHEDTVTAMRRSVVVSGDRSAKIRTYNYPQNRVTDHRINLTKYNLTGTVDGDLDDFIDALHIANNTEKLQTEGVEEGVDD